MKEIMELLKVGWMVFDTLVFGTGRAIMNTSLGALGDFYDAIGHTKIIIGTIIAILSIALTALGIKRHKRH